MTSKFLYLEGIMRLEIHDCICQRSHGCSKSSLLYVNGVNKGVLFPNVSTWVKSSVVFFQGFLWITSIPRAGSECCGRDHHFSGPPISALLRLIDSHFSLWLWLDLRKDLLDCLPPIKLGCRCFVKKRKSCTLEVRLNIDLESYEMGNLDIQLQIGAITL